MLESELSDGPDWGLGEGVLDEKNPKNEKKELSFDEFIIKFFMLSHLNCSFE